jgi:hypothetical protein
LASSTLASLSASPTSRSSAALISPLLMRLPSSGIRAIRASVRSVLRGIWAGWRRWGQGSRTGGWRDGQPELSPPAGQEWGWRPAVQLQSASFYSRTPEDAERSPSPRRRSDAAGA